MKRILLVLASMAAGLAVSTPALADLQLATAKNCMTCHAVDKKLVGPSYKDVAAKYAGQKDAADKLAAKDHQRRLRRLGPRAHARQSTGQPGRSQKAGSLGPGDQISGSTSPQKSPSMTGFFYA
jgi:cytochrome c551/c552